VIDNIPIEPDRNLYFTRWLWYGRHDTLGLTFALAAAVPETRLWF
jgi:hypothetical protein